MLPSSHQVHHVLLLPAGPNNSLSHFHSLLQTWDCNSPSQQASVSGLGWLALHTAPTHLLLLSLQSLPSLVAPQLVCSTYIWVSSIHFLHLQSTVQECLSHHLSPVPRLLASSHAFQYSDMFKGLCQAQLHPDQVEWQPQNSSSACPPDNSNIGCYGKKCPCILLVWLGFSIAALPSRTHPWSCSESQQQRVWSSVWLYWPPDMPTRVMIFDQQVHILHDSGWVLHNTALFNPQSCLLFLARSGSPAKKVNVFDQCTLHKYAPLMHWTHFTTFDLLTNVVFWLQLLSTCQQWHQDLACHTAEKAISQMYCSSLSPPVLQQSCWSVIVWVFNPLFIIMLSNIKSFWVRLLTSTIIHMHALLSVPPCHSCIPLAHLQTHHVISSIALLCSLALLSKVVHLARSHMCPGC